MKKLYVTLLPLISFSLAGMETKTENYFITATVEPFGKCYSTDLSNIEKKSIRVKVVQFMDTENNEIIFSNNKRHGALEVHVPKETPLDIFTENASYIKTRKDERSKPKKIYEFTLKAHKQYSEQSLSDNS